MSETQVPHDCTNCGTSNDACMEMVRGSAKACCSTCSFKDTHGALVKEKEKLRVERTLTIELPESLVRHLATVNNTAPVISPDVAALCKMALAKLPVDEPPLGTCVAWAKRARVAGNAHRVALHSKEATKGWTCAAIEGAPVACWSWEDIWSDAQPGTLRVLVSDTELLN